jgi:molybdate-binding protein/DNA-binding transcriptional regulator YhcF (GntR family)
VGEPAHLYQEIAENLRRRIATGQLTAGDRLPPVRELAAEWQCTPATVSRAYRTLSDEGLVASHPGRGTIVAPGALQPGEGVWPWAALVNRAEQYLLEALARGHTPAQAAAALSVAAGRWAELQQHSQPTVAEVAMATRLRFAGSHDLALGVLGNMLEEATPSVEWQTSFVGSLGGLMALARGEADVAGAHLWDATGDHYNVPFVRRLLPGRHAGLLALARRELGFIVAPGNPLRLYEAADLARPGVRMINRQTGSGTRVWFDVQLDRAGIAGETIAGYDQPVNTHTAVAEAVAGGRADAGVGIYAAARAYDLGFQPLAQEQYDLVMLAAGWESAAGQALKRIVRSPAFRHALVALGGYDTGVTGQESWV